MNHKLLTATISIVCILMMMAITFQPVAANRGPDGTVMQPDIYIDAEGNSHIVYSEMVSYYVTVGNHQIPNWQTEVFYKNNIGLNHGWNAPVQISDSISDSLWPQVSTDSSSSIIYVSWIEENGCDNKFWYVGSDNSGTDFTSPRYGATAPWPVAPSQNLMVNNGVLNFTWRPNGSLTLIADIDGDLIPDNGDTQPMIYNTDNFAIEIVPDVVATDNDLGVTIAIDYGGQDDTFPEVTSTTGDFAISTGDYIEINLETEADFSAIIKLPYTEVPPALNEDYLRMYRQVGDDWVVVTDWELSEFTGINTEHGFVWAYVTHFSTFTMADASQNDGDGDGLTDLTEDTEQSSTTQFTLSTENFYRTNVNTLPDTLTPIFPVDAIFITNVVELQNMANNLNGYYVLLNDIDARETTDWNSGAGFVPIGGNVAGTFTGTFDGQNHVIKELYINRPGVDDVGLFGIAGNAQIRNVGLAGGSISGKYDVGGLIGSNNYATVNNCFSTIDVTGTDFVGGLIGISLDGPVTYCYATGNVAGFGSTGGLIGFNYVNAVTNSFAAAEVSYLGGGLIGMNEGSVINSYYDVEISGTSDNGIGMPKTTAEMKQQGTYVGWDFDNIWWMMDSITYPRFQASYNDLSASYLIINIEPYNTYLAVTGYLEISSTSANPIENLELDIGNDGTIDWRAPIDFDGTLRFGTIRHAISDFMFKNYLNTDAKIAEIPFKFSSSSPGEMYINNAKIIIDDITTDNGLIDTNGDGLVDGWYDQNGNFMYERSGIDGILGNSDDEVPGAVVNNLDPRKINVIGSSGRVPWNEFQDGVNQVNGNLALSSVDLQFKALGHTVMLDRTYNSLNSKNAGPFGYGWDFNYGEKLQFMPYFVEVIAGDGSSYLFEDLEDGTYSSPPGANVNLIFESGIYKLRYTDGTVKIFNIAGQLQEIQDKNGNTLHMIYDVNGNLIRVEDDSGLYLNLIYTGNLITSIVDPAGRTNTYAYDVNGNLVTRTDAMGNEYQYDYYTSVDLEHKILNVINPLGLYKEYQYSGAYPNIVTVCTVGEYDFATSTKTPSHVEYEGVYSYPSHTVVTDANSQDSKRIFDKQGVAIEIQNPDGSSIAKEYDANLNVVKETDGLGNEWQNNYDAMGNQIEQADPLGNAAQTEFQNVATTGEYLSLPTKTIDKNGAETTYEFDANKNPAILTDKNGDSTNYVFSPEGLLLSQTRSNGATIQHTYDAYGNIVTEIDALGNLITYYYDNINRRTGMLDAKGHLTQYGYDALDRTIGIIDPMNNVETHVYDAMGNILSVTDRTGAITTYAYDVFSRKISETDALGYTTNFEYDSRGNLIVETDKRGASTHYVYNAMDRLVEVRDALGFSEIYTYDANGNMIQKQDKLGNFWNNNYDALGRITEEYCPYNIPIKYEYDTEGRMTKRIDRLNYETIYEYDDLGNRIRELGAAGSDTRYSYDSVNNLVSVSQFDGDFDSTWQYDYDLLGRKISETSPLGSTYTWEYDEVGNLIEYFDANNQNTSYAYDALNRVTEMTLPGDINIDITYQITENERQGYDYPPNYEICIYPPRPHMPIPPRLSVQDKDFDLLGRVTKETWVFIDVDEMVSPEYTIMYEYDANGNVIEMTDQFGLITTYTYDALNRLQTLTDPNGDTTTYIYDAVGQLVLTTYPTGTMIFQTYNKANLLTKIENVRSDWTIISSFQYAYNFNANRVSVTEVDGSTIYYSYDMENRLTSVSYPDGSQTQYQYDLRNNLITTTHISGGPSQTTSSVYDDENKLLQSGATTYTYDNNGNMVEGDTYYSYQSTFFNSQKVNQLVSVGTVGGGGGGGEENSVGEGPVTLNSAPSTNPNVVDTRATTYGYALDGRRVSKAGVVNLTYLYDGENVVYELWDNKIVRFTHPSASSCGQKCGGGCGGGKSTFVDHPISITIDGMKFYYLYDGLGSVTELIDGGENIVNMYRYTPFGDALIRQETVYNPYQFTGRQYDAESELYHYRARAYSPDIGRFMQQDPAGMADGANMYAYVGNNPVNGVDPSGNICLGISAFIAGAFKSVNSVVWGHPHGYTAHCYVGCIMRRFGCLEGQTYTWAYAKEYVDILVVYLPGGKTAGGISQQDVSATMWGWFKYNYGGKNCYDVCLYFFPLNGNDLLDTNTIPMTADLRSAIYYYRLGVVGYGGGGPIGGGIRRVPIRI